nr:B3 domain-containing protein LFL1 isoform X2 [Oryza sativa Japonica Group]
MRGEERWQEQPALASHPSRATLRPRGWPRLGLAPTGVGSSCPPAPASELARHLARRAPVSASPPVLPPIKDQGARPPTLAASAAAASSPPPPPPPPIPPLPPSTSTSAARPTDMAGVTSKRRSSSASTSSSSGDGAAVSDRPRGVTRKRRSGGRCPRPAASLRPAAPRPSSHHTAGLRVILQKELRYSDVSQLGRIVLPKKEAEAYLPILTSKDGKKSLCMHDLQNAQLWTFKYSKLHMYSVTMNHLLYRYWPNNKSRMYVLENTGDYVRTHDLQLGDSIVIYKDDENNRFVIGAKKAGDQQAATVPQVDEHISTLFPIFPIAQVDDYLSPMAPQVDISAFVPHADENHEIFDGILNSLPEIPVANVRYSDFFDPFDDGMDMANTLNANANQSASLHVTDDKSGHSLIPNPKSGPHM